MITRLLSLLALTFALTGCAKSTDTPAAASATPGSHEVADFAADVITRSATVPVVVDFWAPWCGPCRVLKPTIEKAAAEAGERWKLVAVNVDNHGPLAQQYGIRSIPAVKLFHRGEVIAEFVGVKSASELRTWLDANLPK